MSRAARTLGAFFTLMRSRCCTSAAACARCSKRAPAAAPWRARALAALETSLAASSRGALAGEGVAAISADGRRLETERIIHSSRQRCTEAVLDGRGSIGGVARLFLQILGAAVEAVRLAPADEKQ